MTWLVGVVVVLAFASGCGPGLSHRQTVYAPSDPVAADAPAVGTATLSSESLSIMKLDPWPLEEATSDAPAVATKTWGNAEPAPADATPAP